MNAYASVLRKGGMYQEAESVLRQLLAQDSTSTEHVMDLVAVLYAQKKWPEAEMYLSQLVRQGSKNLNIYLQLGNTFYNQGKHQQGIDLFERALKQVFPSTANGTGLIYYSLARGYAAINDVPKVLNALRRSEESGYAVKQRIQNEAVFKSLEQNEEYKKLVETLK